MPFNFLYLFLFVSVFLGGCVITEKKHQVVVDHFEMEVPAAPEVHGAGRYLDDHSSVWRFSGGFQAGRQEEEKLDPEENVTGSYEVVYPFFVGTAEFRHKVKGFLFGPGVFINRGLYGNFVIGGNFKYFETGISAGLWLYTADYTYSGMEYSSTTTMYFLFVETDHVESNEPFASRSSIAYTIPLGGYLSVFFEPWSLNFSINAYPVIPYYVDDDVKDGFSYPWIVTEYFVLGYRIDDDKEIRLGASNTFWKFHDGHWSVTGNLCLYI